MIRIVHIITGLEAGGAEVMLANMLSSSDRNSFEPSVISLTDRGMITDRIENLGVSVTALRMPRKGANPAPLLKLPGLLRRLRPDIIQAWMYHANIVGGLAARMAGGIPVVWGIHATRIDRDHMSRRTRATVDLSSWLSPCLAERIVCCSLVSYKFHLVLGYAAEKLLYIPNGFDTERFRPDPASRVSVRSELGLPPETRLIGYVARYDPQKDHDTFLAAARKLAATDPDTHFVLCGSEITPHNTDLVAAIRRHGIVDRCHLLGMREDMPRITASLDLATTASAYGEAFPLVIGEAMACGVPCVVTEVGDSPLIVGETGAAIPPRDPDALSDGWRRLLSLSAEARKVMGERARTRIIEDFSLRQTTRAYEDLYMSVVSAAA